MMEWVDSFGFLQWSVFAVIVFYCFMWLSGSSMFREVDERFFKMEYFDQYYANGFGEIILGIRNGIFLIVLIILFKLVT